MSAVPVQARRLSAPLRSKRLLALAGDERLVEQMRRGNELAFEIAFERHGAAILGFCRHMLGSPEEAEDAVQHTFAAAWRDLEPEDERQIALKPWLFTIARNRCLSMLRSRREQYELPELATAGLPEEVERRAELRELLRDLAELPAEQREALLLTEAGDLTHAEVAGVLGCEVPHVKSLVFRARSGLIARRDARDTPCELIREQLANARGPSLRRNDLRLHLSDCPGCRAYRDEVKRQRELLAAALPVTPAGGLELSVLAAAGHWRRRRRDGRCRRRPRSRRLIARRQARARRRHGGRRGHRREAARGQPGRPAEAGTRRGTGGARARTRWC